MTRARRAVAMSPSIQLVPISFCRSSLFAPDRNLIIAVRVRPNRSISKKFPAVTNMTHSPNIFGSSERTSNMKLKTLKIAAPRLLANDRKLSLLSAFKKLDFTDVVLFNPHLHPQSERIGNNSF